MSWLPDLDLERERGGIVDNVPIYGLIWIDVEDKIIVQGNVVISEGTFLFRMLFSMQTTHLLLSISSIFSAAAGYTVRLENMAAGS